ncbi:hypothetical protein K458DRAFT_492943 [Lentithecium fluviatile CBS 122367]|uniref:Citrate transporter-like domain-containing protein n=1 Tax=Lentithecium fluviatile CBS 122367 TaxID=1168545 RepID=A0A6G1ICB7_9PLEO|nr:hypothetical protein K458DRAFT_492943 [Lentithecium fluviatile CBS 122367]
MSETSDPSLDWRSGISLAVFIIANVIFIFPFWMPVYVPRKIVDIVLDALSTLRVVPSRLNFPERTQYRRYALIRIPVNLVTVPLVAILFLLAVSAIGRNEIHDGTIASGLIRYLAFKILQKIGQYGHVLFTILYAASFGFGGIIGNDPIIEFGMGIVATVSRLSSNIKHPQAWIYSQFAVVNIASAILESSNPCNVIIATMFDIKFWSYSAYMIVPVLASGIVMLPFLVYIRFDNEALIPRVLKMHELPEELQCRKPVNDAIPNAKGRVEEGDEEAGLLMTLEDLLNPFLDKGGALIGVIILVAAIVVLFVLSAISKGRDDPPVFWVTLPASVLMMIWNLVFGWLHRHETRRISREGREMTERARAERAEREEREMEEQRRPEWIRRGMEENKLEALGSILEPRYQRMQGVKTWPANAALEGSCVIASAHPITPWISQQGRVHREHRINNDSPKQTPVPKPHNPAFSTPFPTGDGQALSLRSPDGTWIATVEAKPPATRPPSPFLDPTSMQRQTVSIYSSTTDLERNLDALPPGNISDRRPTTLLSLLSDAHTWLQETFPSTVVAVSLLPLKFVPFVFFIFILVEALRANNWIPVFAHGWDLWASRTGTVGSIAGMGFLSVILCNFAGTNFGSTLLLSHILIEWETIHQNNNNPISDRQYKSCIYAMALGVNYGAFSTVFGASVSGLQWKESLERKGFQIRKLDFARANAPIVAVAMGVSCLVLVGEMYIIKK